LVTKKVCGALGHVFDFPPTPFPGEDSGGGVGEGGRGMKGGKG